MKKMRFKLWFAAVKSFPDPSHTVDGAELAVILNDIAEHGDWVLTRGISLPDNMVATATNMPLSHAALYDKENNQVIESDSEGVHTTPFGEFLSQMHRVIVIRPMWATIENCKAAVENARNLIGQGYNYTGLVGLGVKDRYYCTELAIEAYRPFVKETPDNPIPRVIKPGQMYHWGRIIFDTGPYMAD